MAINGLPMLPPTLVFSSTHKAISSNKGGSFTSIILILQSTPLVIAGDSAVIGPPESVTRTATMKDCSAAS